MSEQLHAPAALPAQIKPPVSAEQEAGWPQSWSGWCEKENSGPYQDLNSDHSVIQTSS